MSAANPNKPTAIEPTARSLGVTSVHPNLQPGHATPRRAEQRTKKNPAWVAGRSRFSASEESIMDRKAGRLWHEPVGMNLGAHLGDRATLQEFRTERDCTPRRRRVRHGSDDLGSTPHRTHATADCSFCPSSRSLAAGVPDPLGPPAAALSLQACNHDANLAQAGRIYRKFKRLSRASMAAGQAGQK